MNVKVAPKGDVNVNVSADANAPRVLSTTAINEASLCLKRYEYHYVAGLVPKADRVSPALRRGIWVHAALAEVARRFPTGGLSSEVDSAVESSLDMCMSWAERHGADPAVLERMRDECRDVLRNYFAYWGPDGSWGTILAVEEPLVLTVGDPPIALRATVDKIVRRPGGDVWIIEHKTTSRIPTATWRAVDPQTAIQIALAATQEQYKDIRGIIFDYIQTDGKASGKPFTRHLVPYNAKQVRSALRDVSFVRMSIGLCERTGHWPRSFNLVMCQRFCPYGEVCVAEYVQGDSPSVLRHELFTKEDENDREGRW